MQIQFRQGSESLPQKLIDRAQMKIAKLSRFITEQNYEAYARVDVDRESGATQSEQQWRASINLNVAEGRFNATGSGNTPDKAVDLAIKDMKREVRKAHAKHQTVRRQGSTMLKQLQRRLSM